MSAMTPKMKSLKFEIHLFVEKDKEGYIAYCPAFRGILVGGDTEDETIKNYKEAFMSHIISILIHNDPLPICKTFKVESTIEPIIQNIEIPLDANYGYSFAV